ncbi:MAG TPA: ABC transporter permease, partial [Quisquiliibacterium sp.]|nr:ABC transporter permease [Quisquiliibacterium sp.]
ALPEGLRGLLQLTGRPDSGEAATAAAAFAAVPSARPVHWPGMRTLALVGGVLLAAVRWLRGRAMPLGREVLRQLDEAGPGALAIVVLTCGLIGLMLAYMGGAQLERMGAQGFLADVVTVGMVRELAGLMTGIVLAGRVASAFAAQLASMQAGEEIDALVVLGVDPVEHLVLPRLAALLLAAPALLAFGALAGVLAGWPAAVLSYGLSSAEYFAQCTRALTFTHLWIGLFKGVVYAGLVGLAGCREGLYAGRSAQDMGRAATAAVVRALVWVIGAACLSTVVFTSLGY